MSSRHAQIARTPEGWFLRDLGSKNGCFVQGCETQHALLFDGAIIEVGDTVLVFRERMPLGPADPRDLDLEHLDAGPLPRPLVTVLPALARELDGLARVARTRVPILITGETGTGKELISRAVHQLSQRAGDFVAVSCAAIPEALVESTLFGHHKGAFSGATESRPGLVRMASGGTLFLDEVAELSESSQIALLRVLQQSEVTPVGYTLAQPVELRVVAATHHDLARRIAAGRFRADLYARIAGHVVELPALRERREDLGAMIGGMLARIGADRGRPLRLSRAAARVAFAHDWPLNARELENTLRAAAALADGPAIELEHLPHDLRDRYARGSADDEARNRLVAALRAHRGNVSAVARDLGKARAQIHRRIRRFGLDPRAFRG